MERMAGQSFQDILQIGEKFQALPFGGAGHGKQDGGGAAATVGPEEQPDFLQKPP